MIQFTQILFIVIVLLLIGTLFSLLKKSFIFYRRIFISILGWLIFTGVLAKTGFLMSFNSLPPRIMMIIFPMVVLLIYTIFSKHIVPLIKSTSQAFLIYVQSFRVMVELVLYLLAAQHIIPEIMTWNGRNVDILIGLTAPIIGYFCCTKKVWPTSIIKIWNYLGVMVLLNVVIHANLSTPTPFQVFIVEPSNTFIGDFPYVWLPGFLVPCALFFHILSIRKCTLES